MADISKIGLLFGGFAPLATTATIGAAVGIGYGETHRNRKGDPDWARGADAGILGYEAATIANNLVGAGLFRGAEFKKAALFGDVDYLKKGKQDLAPSLKSSFVEQSNVKYFKGLIGKEGIGFAHPMHDMALHSGAYAISGFLTGMSIFGSSQRNTTNIQAGIITGAVMGGLSFASQLRYGRSLLKRALIN